MRWFVGLLLIAAAILKSLDLYQHPSSVFGDSFSRFLMPLLVSLELGLGLTAIAGLYWRQLRPLAMLLFAGFACYSLLLAIQGAASCGCFGPLAINPWWTFMLDVVVFVGLTLEYLRSKQVENNSDGAAKPSLKFQLVGIVVLSMGVAIGLGWHVALQPSSAKDGFQTADDLIILEPETWVGQDFPLLKHIDIDVSHGNWVLLLHRHDCPKCQEAIPKYGRLALAESDKQVAIINVPPYALQQEIRPSLCHIGRLSDLREWFVETPVEIQLDNGVVTSASTELPSLHNLAETDGKQETSLSMLLLKH